MLEQIGAECAGAVTFLPSGQELAKRDYHYRKLDEGEEVSLPLGSAPSTPILKPAVERFAGVVFNEAPCMTLAAHMNLPAAKVETRRVEDVEYLKGSSKTAAMCAKLCTQSRVRPRGIVDPFWSSVFSFSRDGRGFRTTA